MNEPTQRTDTKKRVWLYRHYERLKSPDGEDVEGQPPTIYGDISARIAAAFFQAETRLTAENCLVLTSPQPRARGLVPYFFPPPASATFEIVEAFDDPTRDETGRAMRREAHKNSLCMGITREHAMLLLPTGRSYLYDQAGKAIKVLAGRLQSPDVNAIVLFGHGGLLEMVGLVLTAMISDAGTHGSLGLVELETLHIGNLPGGVLNTCEAIVVDWRVTTEMVVTPVKVETRRLPPVVKALRAIL